MLTELDERAATWRIRHYSVVARIIGDEVVGTQGTPVELLGGLIKHEIFPELWQRAQRADRRCEDRTARAELKAALWGGGDYERVADCSGHARPAGRALEPRPGERWLDVGTGTGGVAIRAAAQERT